MLVVVTTVEVVDGGTVVVDPVVSVVCGDGTAVVVDVPVDEEQLAKAKATTASNTLLIRYPPAAGSAYPDTMIWATLPGMNPATKRNGMARLTDTVTP